jgi:hypothetical protein
MESERLESAGLGERRAAVRHVATVINSCAVLWKPAGERPTVRGIFEIVGLGQAVRVGVGLIGSGFVIVGTYL